MYIRALKLKQFRNYIKKEIEFSKDLNLIIGPNGSGKTNILEAITTLSLGKSNKAVKTADMINVSYDFASITTILDNNDKLEVIIQSIENSSRASKTYKINGAIKSQTKFAGHLKSVYFGPEHIRLIAGSPSRRRDYLNQMLSQIHYDYRKALSLYNRVLKQRNKLLESVKGQVLLNIHETQLDFWNSQLLSSGMTLQKFRHDFFRFANENLPKISKSLYDEKFTLKLNYLPRTLSEEAFKKVKKREILYGTTKIGPHLDDFEFVLVSSDGEFPLKNFGSRGQQRTGVLCVKVLELDYIKKDEANEIPVLLLDDIFSELDKDYRDALKDIIKKQQTIITTADKNMVPKDILKTAKVLNLSVNND